MTSSKPGKESVQDYIEPWWEKDESKQVKRGTLLKAFVLHADKNPLVMIPEGRAVPTDHKQAKYRVEPLKIKNPPRRPRLPVAALPQYTKEVWAAYRAKTRPVLVLSTGGPDIPKSIHTGMSNWQYAGTLLVAPFYGGTQDGSRGGWNTKFVDRIRTLEYPNYLLDNLPIDKKVDQSILRLDQIQPLGRQHDIYEKYDWCLSAHALEIIDIMLSWLITGIEPSDDEFFVELRETLLNGPLA